MASRISSLENFIDDLAGLGAPGVRPDVRVALLEGSHRWGGVDVAARGDPTATTVIAEDRAHNSERHSDDDSDWEEARVQEGVKCAFSVKHRDHADQLIHGEFSVLTG
ncbi:MAG: hypothetical protein H6814_08940 [Phycisphaeraceae bacterium]|nr:hypothetical protein [Phycisphaeraceae bacterium]